MGLLDTISRKIQGVDRLDRQKLDIHAKQWVNTKAVDISKLKGKVILVEFAAIESESKEIIDQLNIWDQMFPKDSFQMISVYSPKAKEMKKVKLFASKTGMKYPIALDSNMKTADLFNVRFRPIFFLFDRKGRLRYRILNTKDLERIGSAIMKLLSQK